MPAVSDLRSVIAATTQWLLHAYPTTGRAFSAELARAQARQAVTVACWLRYPDPADVALLMLLGPGGAARLDEIAGTDTTEADTAWRTWVDEVAASWAACLLADPELAADAVDALAPGTHIAGRPVDFRRLTAPEELDRGAAVLLRHPDLLAPVADLHRASLLDLLGTAREAA